MKIQCQKCTKVYLISKNQIGKAGRKVKCENCNHTWHEYPLSEPKFRSIRTKKLAFTTVGCVAFLALYFTIFSQNDVKKMYNTYKDSISYKLLRHKKEQTDNSNVAINEFYQDYLLLSNLKHS